MRIQHSFLVLLMIVLLAGCTANRQPSSNDSALTPEQQLVLDAQKALEDLAKNDTIPPYKSFFADAKGVIIFPALYKGSYFVGVETGQGLLLTKQADGQWSGPAFISLSELSFGFQAGGQMSTVLLMLMKDTYVEDALTDNLQLAADVSVAAGPAGHSGQMDRSTHTGGIIYVASTKGLAFSMALEGGGIAVNEKRNANYYGMGVTPKEIMQGNVNNPQANSLRDLLARYATEAQSE